MILKDNNDGIKYMLQRTASLLLSDSRTLKDGISSSIGIRKSNLSDDSQIILLPTLLLSLNAFRLWKSFTTRVGNRLKKNFQNSPKRSFLEKPYSINWSNTFENLAGGV